MSANAVREPELREGQGNLGRHVYPGVQAVQRPHGGGSHWTRKVRRSLPQISRAGALTARNSAARRSLARRALATDKIPSPPTLVDENRDPALAPAAATCSVLTPRRPLSTAVGIRTRWKADGRIALRLLCLTPILLAAFAGECAVGCGRSCSRCTQVPRRRPAGLYVGFAVGDRYACGNGAVAPERLGPTSP